MCEKTTTKIENQETRVAAVQCENGVQNRTHQTERWVRVEVRALQRTELKVPFYFQPTIYQWNASELRLNAERCISSNVATYLAELTGVTGVSAIPSILSTNCLYSRLSIWIWVLTSNSDSIQVIFMDSLKKRLNLRPEHSKLVILGFHHQLSVVQDLLSVRLYTTCCSASGPPCKTWTSMKPVRMPNRLWTRLGKHVIMCPVLRLVQIRNRT